jgi:hypothetical protein
MSDDTLKSNSSARPYKLYRSIRVGMKLLASEISIFFYILIFLWFWKFYKLRILECILIIYIYIYIYIMLLLHGHWLKNLITINLMMTYFHWCRLSAYFQFWIKHNEFRFFFPSSFTNMVRFRKKNHQICNVLHWYSNIFMGTWHCFSISICNE